MSFPGTEQQFVARSGPPAHRQENAEWRRTAATGTARHARARVGDTVGVPTAAATAGRHAKNAIPATSPDEPAAVPTATTKPVPEPWCEPIDTPDASDYIAVRSHGTVFRTVYTDAVQPVTEPPVELWFDAGHGIRLSAAVLHTVGTDPGPRPTPTNSTQSGWGQQSRQYAAGSVASAAAPEPTIVADGRVP